MSQFDIVINKDSNSSEEVPFLINLQSDPMDLLATRIVAPLRKEADYSDQKLTRIHIPIKIKEEEYIIFISEIAAIPLDGFGDKVMNASVLRQEVTCAIDLLFTGF